MSKKLQGLSAAALTAAAIGWSGVLSSQALAAGGEYIHIERHDWSFSGMLGTFDREQLRRGYQIYADTCSGCHSMKLLRYRNLSEKGGPELPIEKMKEIAAEAEIQDGPNAEGEMFDRPGKPFDRFKSPYANDAEARAANNGALPPDLSVITRARSVHLNYSWYLAPFVWLEDIISAYQEGGADYVYALMNGYTDVPKYVKQADGSWKKLKKGETAPGAEECVSASKESGCVKLAEGMSYNTAFPGHQIAMGPQLDNKQDAEDITAFLAWAAEPHLEARKTLGLRVLLYLLVLAGLMYLVKKRVWAGVKH